MTFFDVKVAEKDGEVFTISGSRNVMGKYFASKSKELATGGYRFDEVGGSPNTFSSWLQSDFNFVTKTGTRLEIVNCKVKVLKSGTEYELTFDLVAQDGKKVTGYYKGIPKVYGSSPIDNIFLSKQQGFSMRKGSFTEAK